MRPTEVTNEQIIDAGNQIISAGRSVTGFALRKIIKAGDANRLKKVWDEYLLSQSVSTSEPVAELPIEVAEEVALVSRALSEKISLLAIELNDKAVKASERRVAELVRTTGEQRLQAERELADASETVDDLERQLDEKESEIEKLHESLDISRSLTQTQAVEIAQLKERLVATEKTAKTETERATAQISKLSDENLALSSQRSGLKQELDNTRTELADKNALINHLTIDLQKLNTETADLKEKLAAGNNALADKKALIVHQQSDIEKLTTEMNQQKHELNSVQNELTDLKSKHFRDVEQIEDLSSQLAKGKSELANANKIASDTREALAKLSGQLEAANTQNSALLLALGKNNLNA